MLNNADTNAFSKICLVTGYTDLRRGIDGLSAMIQSSYELDPYETVPGPMRQDHQSTYAYLCNHRQCKPVRQL